MRNPKHKKPGPKPIEGIAYERRHIVALLPTEWQKIATRAKNMGSSMSDIMRRILRGQEPPI